MAATQSFIHAPSRLKRRDPIDVDPDEHDLPSASSRRTIADYIDTSLNDALRRVPGVSDTQIFGFRYAMRIWLDLNKLAKYH